MRHPRNKFVKWKNNIEGKCLKVNRRKTKVMVSSIITKDGLSRSKPEACEVCPRKMCRSVTAKISRNFACRKCNGNIGKAVEQEEK